MKDYTKLLIEPDLSLEEAIRHVENLGSGIAFIADASGRLLGALSDGDVRRAILCHKPLDGPVRDAMNPSPKTVAHNTPASEAQVLMDLHRIRFVPVLDEAGRIVHVFAHEDVHTDPARDNMAVIMCGGLGSRLKELTQKTPKPLLPVGGQPILETIVGQLGKHGFRNVVLATNYKADMINGHMGNGDHLGVQIDYVREKQRLGTAGALKLLGGVNGKPLLVMNGDILTKVNFDAMLEYHQACGWAMTICMVTYDLRIPYGVIDADSNGQLQGIREKPMQRFFINAGIYVLNPALIDLIPDNEYFDMTDLVNAACANGMRAGTFPIHEYWIDVGRMEEYHRANREYAVHFASEENRA